MATQHDTTETQTTETAHSRLDVYSADLGSAAVVAEMAANQCACDGEASAVFDVLQRELDRLSWNVGAVAQALREGSNGAAEPNGADSISSTNTVERGNEDPLDELTLSLSRAEALAQAVVDVGMSGEERDIVGIAVMIRREMEIARNICTDDLHNSKYWRIKAGGAS